MFDTIVDHVKEEIAFEGENGVNATQLWDLVREAVNKELQKSNGNDVGPVNLDDAYMKFIWPTLLVPDLEFYEDLDVPSDCSTTGNAVEHNDNNQPNTPEESDKPHESDQLTVDEPSEDTAAAPGNDKQQEKKRSSRGAKGSKRVAKKKPAKRPPRKKRAKTKVQCVDDCDYDDDDDDSDGAFVPDDDSSEDDYEDDYDVVPEEDSDEEMEEVEEEKTTKSKKIQPKEETLLFKETVKKNLRRIHDIESLSFDDVIKQYGNRLCVLATKQLQEKQLFYGVPPGRILSPNQTMILKLILKARASGISQAELTRTLGTDPRSTGHYVKALEKDHAIVRKPLALRGLHTNLCIHKRFCGDEYTDELVADFAARGTKAPINVNASGVFFTNSKLKESLVELLEGAKGHTMFVMDILSALGFNTNEKRVRKWFYCNLQTIHIKGAKIVKLAAVKKSANRNFRCVKLIKEDEPAENTGMPTDLVISGDDSTYTRSKGRLVLPSKMNIPRHSRLMRDVTYDQQIFSLIEELGTAGATSRDFRTRITYLDHKSLWKVLDNMLNLQSAAAKKHQIARHLEFDGRLRQYRYFTLKAYSECIEKKPIDVDTPVPPLKIDPARLVEVDFRDYNVKPPPKKIGRPRKVVEDGASKRPRGRPRKRPLPDNDTKAEGSNDSQPDPKKSKPNEDITPESTAAASETSTARGKGKDKAPAARTTRATRSKAAGLQPMDTETTSAQPTDAVQLTENIQSEPQTEDLSSMAPVKASSDELVPEPVSVGSGAAREDNVETVSKAPQAATVKSSKTSSSAKQPTTIIGHTKAGIKVVKHISQKGVNNLYLERRRKTLLALLEEQPIVEVGARMRYDFRNKLEELYPGSKQSHIICLKTLWSTARNLEEEGLIQTTIVKSIHLSGSTTESKVVVRKDIDMNGPEMELFKQQLQESKILARAYLRMAKPGIVKADDVETLDARLSRMQNMLEDAEGAEADRLRERIKTMRSNMDLASEIATQYPGKTTGGNWLTIAMQFGFVYARMIRTKLLHQYLFGLVQQKIEGVTEDNTIPTTIIVNEMTVTLYLQLIGFFQLTPEVHEFVRDPKHLELKMKEVPEAVKNIFLTDKNRFRRRLRMILDIATNLGVLEPKYRESQRYDFENKASSLPNAYKVLTQVAIRDYRQQDAPVISTYDLNSSSDVAIYWSELQFLCTSRDTRDTRGDSAIIHESFMQNEFVSALYSTKNWTVSNVYTREQRKALNQYIDKKKHTTPLKNSGFCRTLAESLDLPLAMVTSYFKRMEDAFQRKSDMQAAKKLARRLYPKRRRRKPTSEESQEQKAVTRNKKRAFERLARGQSVADVVRKRALCASAQEADEEDLPLIDEDKVHATLGPLRRAPRRPWSEEEDDLVIYAYVILKHRGRYSRLSWHPLKQVFPDRKPEICRHRVNVLRKNPERIREIDILSKTWPSLYEEGLREGAFKDDNNLEMINFDLVGQLQYFVRHLQDAQDTEISGRYRTIVLPSTVDEIMNYEIEYFKNDSFNLYLEDSYHNCQSILQRNQVLSSQSFTTLADSSMKTDMLPDDMLPELQTDDRIEQLLQVFFRMILLTPAETYDPFFAYGLLNRYSKDIQKSAIEKAHSRGVLIKAKGSLRDYRRLPGTFYGLGRKYEHRMAGSLPPNFFAQASNYEKLLRTQGRAEFNPVMATSGVMACLLAMISTDKVQFGILNHDLELAKHLIPIYRTRLLDQSLTNFPIETIMEGNVEDGDPMDIEPPTTNVRSLDDAAFEVEWSGFFHTQDAEIRPVLHAIVDHLRQVQGQGATLPEIKKKVLEDFPEADDALIHDCVDRLIQRCTPLIHRVGFGSLRYVLVKHLDDWVIDARSAMVSPPNAVEVKTEENGNPLVIKQDIIDPRMWRDITGNCTTSVLASCEENVFQKVLQRPGITERSLHRHMQDLLTYTELREILENLVRRGILRSQTFVARKSSMFSRPSPAPKLPSYGIDANAETHYWTLPTFYNKLAQ